MWLLQSTHTHKHAHKHIHTQACIHTHSYAHIRIYTPSQVRELSNESLRLATNYPGPNAAVITSSMEGVQSSWDSLQVSAGARKRKLRAALDLQKFLASVSVCVWRGGVVRMYHSDFVLWFTLVNHIFSSFPSSRFVTLCRGCVTWVVCCVPWRRGGV